jgi:hypothetical protein
VVWGQTKWGTGGKSKLGRRYPELRDRSAADQIEGRLAHQSMKAASRLALVADTCAPMTELGERPADESCASVHKSLLKLSRVVGDGVELSMVKGYVGRPATGVTRNTNAAIETNNLK